MRAAASIAAVLVATAVVISVLRGSGGEPPTLPAGAVARLGDGDMRAITRTELHHWTDVTRKQEGRDQPSSALGSDGGSSNASLRDRVLGCLIESAWIENEAAAREIEIAADEVRRRVDRIVRDQFGDGNRYRRYLRDSGMTEADVAQRVRVDVLTCRLRDALREGGAVSRRAIERYYERNMEAFRDPEHREVRIILNRSQTQVERAKESLSGDRSSRGWTRAARLFSEDDATLATGGLLPAVASGELNPVLDHRRLPDAPERTCRARRH